MSTTTATRQTTLIRTMQVGDRLSFDGGRIVVQLRTNSPRRAELRLVMAEDVVVDKPRSAANDEGRAPEGC